MLDGVILTPVTWGAGEKLSCSMGTLAIWQDALHGTLFKFVQSRGDCWLLDGVILTHVACWSTMGLLTIVRESPLDATESLPCVLGVPPKLCEGTTAARFLDSTWKCDPCLRK